MPETAAPYPCLFDTRLDVLAFVRAIPIPFPCPPLFFKVICSNERFLVWPFPGSKVSGDGVPEGALDPPAELSKARSVRGGIVANPDLP